MGALLQFPGGAPVGQGAWSEQSRLWWLLWSGCPGLGWSRLAQIQGLFGSWAEAWQAPLGLFEALPGFGPSLGQRLGHYREAGPGIAMAPPAEAPGHCRRRHPAPLPPWPVDGPCDWSRVGEGWLAGGEWVGRRN